MSAALPAASPAGSTSRAGVRGGALTVLLGPMLTLPALRRLLMEGHGATPAGKHAFVAAGMTGSALGAPLIARRADHLRLAIVLAVLHALVGLATASARLPTELGARPRALLAPLCGVMTQRFVIGGLVASFAVHARAVHGLTDARIGASFSLELVVFAVGVFALGRRWSGVKLGRCMPVCRALAAAPIHLLIPISRPIGGFAATFEEHSWRREQ